MATDKKTKPQQPVQQPQQNVQKPAQKNTEKQIPSNVINMADHKCKAESCKAKPQRAGFCDEHYTWFKEGLITIDGYNAKDFEKKYAQYLSRKKVA